jgi:hypothetical protein
MINLPAKDINTTENTEAKPILDMIKDTCPKVNTDKSMFVHISSSDRKTKSLYKSL